MLTKLFVTSRYHLRFQYTLARLENQANFQTYSLGKISFDSSAKLKAHDSF